ncbi:MAG TPA: DNA internalization-related competence protein ComEC/Rec2 [Nocardioidaceae bacterium]|nr:DNA internalization-related competence protein ComEC/Rec2 [Nocardioidaceae bacterium]
MTAARPEPAPPDLRAFVLALMAWAGGLAGFLLPAWVVASAVVGGALLLGVRHRRGRPVVVGLAWLVAAAAVAGSAMLRVEGVSGSALARLADQRAFVSADVRVTSDPLVRQGRFDSFTLLRATTVEVTGRGSTQPGRVPVLLIADEEWQEVELGSVVRVQGRAAPSDGEDLAAVISTNRPPIELEPAGELLDGAAAVRAGIRQAVAGAGPGERTLVPALVVGDDKGMPAEVVDDFQAAGLTHLLAVSGTNLTLVVGFVLVIARWVGVRARGLVAVGILGVVGFVLLARTEPSVVRAAAMGSVALIGMGSNGREKGVRALGVAVLALLLLDPWMALSLGFVLSALATAGILFLAPPWRDALSTWTPRWLAEAIAVPLAAQIACTPVVAAISDQVSLVAVAANMVVAPAVGPATVLGLAGGLVVLLVEPAGVMLGRGAGWCAWWIIAAAKHSAALPTAAVGWSSAWGSVLLLCILSLGAAWVMPALLARRGWAVAVGGLVMLAVVRPLPTPGWPPEGWVLVACDVGQGDAIVLNAGAGRAVVVDAGPEPGAIDRCLDRLEVEELPAVVLTHFHDDHVAGLPGVLEERPLDEVLVTALADPAEGAAAVTSWVSAAGVPVRVPPYGEVRRLGSLTWQVVGPSGRFATGEAVSEGSAANNASVALLVETRGIRILLTGDMEPEAQEALRRALPSLRVDVLKVPHHGSRYQDAEFLTGLGARVAIVSVGRDNTYGHPAAETLDLLEKAGALVLRTDQSGDVALVVREGQLTARELSTSSSAMR